MSFVVYCIDFSICEEELIVNHLVETSIPHLKEERIYSVPSFNLLMKIFLKFKKVIYFFSFLFWRKKKKKRVKQYKDSLEEELSMLN